MPPRIRSETPEEEDELDELASPELPQKRRKAANDSDDALSTPPQSEEEEDELADEDEELPIKAQSMKIKFKLGTATPQDSWASSSSTSTRKGKGRQESSDEEMDLHDDDSDNPSSDEDGHSSVGSARLTARQRAKEQGIDGATEELQQLPLKKGGKTAVKLTDAEAAFKKAETARKRKHQLDKKLEDEKTETINRLLKKQAGRTTGRKAKPATAGDAIDPDEPAPIVLAAPPAPPPTRQRYISSIKTGEYATFYAIPYSAAPAELKSTVFTGYPGPRPPPKTRRLVKV